MMKKGFATFLKSFGVLVIFLSFMFGMVCASLSMRATSSEFADMMLVWTLTDIFVGGFFGLLMIGVGKTLSNTIDIMNDRADMLIAQQQETGIVKKSAVSKLTNSLSGL